MVIPSSAGVSWYRSESARVAPAITAVSFTGKFITALTYGGRLSGTAFPDVFYVGLRGSTAPFLLHRVTLGGSISPLTAYPGISVRAMTMDPQNYKNLYVLDSRSEERRVGKGCGS